MKSIFTKLVSTCLLAGLFSCNSSLDVMKRHYTDGFYVNHTGKIKSSDERQTAKNKKLTEVNNEIVASDEIKDDMVNIKATVQKTVIALPDKNATAKTFSENQKKNKVSYKSETEEEQNALAKNNGSLKKEEKLKGADASADAAQLDSDGMFILELILSLLLPPLAVYLKQKSITKWFWITLILCLLTGGVAFAGYLGSLWFIAFVFALLVVLDILN